MTLYHRLTFFLSAFTPLWVIWGLRLYLDSAVGANWVIFAATLSIASILATLSFVMRLKRGADIYLNLEGITYRDGDILAYVITYIPVFVLSDFSDVGMVVAIFSIYIVLAILFIRLDIAYVNPTMALLGYRVVGAQDAESGRNVILITKDDTLLSAERLRVRQLSNGRLYYHH